MRFHSMTSNGIQLGKLPTVLGSLASSVAQCHSQLCGGFQWRRTYFLYQYQTWTNPLSLGLSSTYNIYLYREYIEAGLLCPLVYPCAKSKLTFMVIHAFVISLHTWTSVKYSALVLVVGLSAFFVGFRLESMFVPSQSPGSAKPTKMCVTAEVFNQPRFELLVSKRKNLSHAHWK